MASLRYNRFMNPEALGFIAGSLSVLSLVPQVVKSFRTRSTGDISLEWTVINLCGQILWIVYGALIGSVSLYIMSSISLLMAATMLVLKLRYGLRNEAPPKV
jgi:MtN3 and saliva related transmembrane protein